MGGEDFFQHLKCGWKIIVVDLLLKFSKGRAESASQQIMLATDQITGPHVVILEQGQQAGDQGPSFAGITLRIV